jgi:hypothetical protein
VISLHRTSRNFLGVSGSIQNQPFMQTSDCGGSGGGEKEWKHAVDKARQTGANHLKGKPGGGSQVLAVGFADSRGMFSER